MPNPSQSPAPRALSDRPYVVALAGMAALAAAMGIGRFAFTPLLPMMLSDGVITLVDGSWLATANYVGYLLGALACMALPWVAPESTPALAPGTPGPLGPGGHGAAHAGHGVALAMGLGGAAVRCGGGQCGGAAQYCSLVHVAPGGAGAARAGRADFQRAGPGHCAHGLVGQRHGGVALARCGGLGGVWPAVRGAVCTGVAGGAGSAAGGGCSQLRAVANPPGLGPAARGVLTLAYGLAGLGYIVTATFLPVIARAALPAGSVWPDLFWPLFGMGVAMGAALSTRAPVAWDRRWLLLVAYLLQAAAIGLSLVWPGAAGFALGSWLLGLPFTAITFFGLQEARRVWPSAGDSFTGLLTAAYGLGQIIGPPMVAWTLHRAATPSQGFTQGLVAAAAALLLGAALYAVMVWRWPLRAR